MADATESRGPRGRACRRCGSDHWYLPRGEALRCYPCKLAANRAWNTKRRRARGEGVEGNCAVCGVLTKLRRDHDHTTGADRGKLCHGCNTALGLVYDRPGVLRALADYIERWENHEYIPTVPV